MDEAQYFSSVISVDTSFCWWIVFLFLIVNILLQVIKPPQDYFSEFLVFSLGLMTWDFLLPDVTFFWFFVLLCFAVYVLKEQPDCQALTNNFDIGNTLSNWLARNSGSLWDLFYADNFLFSILISWRSSQPHEPFHNLEEAGRLLQTKGNSCGKESLWHYSLAFFHS